MSTYLNTKQQRLIEEYTKNHVKYYDKISGQYLKTRQDILQLNSSIIQDIKLKQEVSNSNKIKLYELQFELDKNLEAYKHHINDLSQHISIKIELKSPYQDDINQQHQKLIERRSKLNDKIIDIEQVQKPKLDKMKLLVKSFDLNSKSSTTKAYIQARKEGESENSTEIDLQSLRFTRDEIQFLFEDVYVDLHAKYKDDPKFDQAFNLNQSIEEQLKNGKPFVRLENKEDPKNPIYQYKIDKSTLQSLDRYTTIDDYDKLIKSTLTSIESLVQQGIESKESWTNNARKIEIIKESLDKHDDQNKDIDMIE
ncbi:hypothetical protein DFJ63DRAFT_318566 [Scheffersomyces coipomensis]|uniref:uncharacterized protein n=1 Tax=Scheffersomyces coipomensis TaxID=1788519 RepID=UPI00315D443E